MAGSMSGGDWLSNFAVFLTSCRHSKLWSCSIQLQRMQHGLSAAYSNLYWWAEEICKHCSGQLPYVLFWQYIVPQGAAAAADALLTSSSAQQMLCTPHPVDFEFFQSCTQVWLS